MRNSHAPKKRLAAFVTAVLCCLAALESEALAQAGRAKTYSVGRRIEAMNRQAGEYEREDLERDLEHKPGGSTNRKPSKEVAAQVQQDFSRIQVIYNEVVMTMTAGKKLDPAFISESAAGINKVAGRLKTNLALPQEKEKTKNPAKPSDIDGEQMNASLTMLLNHISSFVTNPLFESANVLDVDLSTKAGRDLSEIIELSETIRKKAEKLKGSH